MAARKKPRLGVWKFSSCDGCQLTLLDCETELLAIADEIEIAYFLEATRREDKGRYDIALVEGSVTTPEEARKIRDVRRRSNLVLSVGACATTGGIQALRNFRDVKGFIDLVYAHPEYIDTLATSTAFADHIHVDFELRGCPPNKNQLLEVLSAYVAGRRPVVPTHSECMECKARGTVCVMVAQGTACMGPVTQAGCGNLCPSYDRGCYGCFGQKETPNTGSLAAWWREQLRMDGRDVRRRFSTYNANAPAFREESERHG